ncbi:AAA family ATPase [Streptomyces sp. NPDC091292]|uniref:AAA family ATPase n=1 Tax=Streptomyces sp. NPDC091292 TaxID=3365991 RepID=UPI00381F5853
MTAPLTPPPHHQPPHQPWGAAYTGGQVPPTAYEEDGPGMKTELRQAAVITLAITVGGLLLGLLWLWLSPRVPLIASADAVYLKDTEGEQAIAIDGTFTLLGLGFGAVTALVVFLVRRRGGIPLVAALALGGLLGSVVAWRFGVWLGPTQDVVAHAKEVGKGITFDAPLELKAKGALLAWPVAALLVHLGLTGLFGPRDPDPYPYPSPYVPQGPHPFTYGPQDGRPPAPPVGPYGKQPPPRDARPPRDQP